MDGVEPRVKDGIGRYRVDGRYSLPGKQFGAVHVGVLVRRSRLRIIYLRDVQIGVWIIPNR